MTAHPLPAQNDRKPLAYIVGFFVIWTGYVAFLYPQVEKLGVDTFAFAMLHLTFKILIWIVPIFLYLRFVDGVNPLDYMKLRQKWKTGVAAALVLSAINFGIFVAQFGLPRLEPSRFSWVSIVNISIAIGFIEEIPFRGFMLQKLNILMNFWIANLITSLLFLLVHIIGWILLGSEQTLYLYVAIFIFSFVMGIVFRYTDSLWSCIIVHSINDFYSIVLFAR